MRPVGKIERALGMNLGLKPHRCNSPKCPYIRRQSRPGVHARSRRRALSEYGRELLEKQRVRFAYQIDERALARYVQAAKKSRMETGTWLLSLLERRLDSVIARAGLASSRREARLLIRHGHFVLNGNRVRSPALLMKEGDEVRVREASRALGIFRELEKAMASQETPPWLTVSPDVLSVKLMRLPSPEELLSSPFDTRLVVEYYSR